MAMTAEEREKFEKLKADWIAVNPNAQEVTGTLAESWERLCGGPEGVAQADRERGERLARLSKALGREPTFAEEWSDLQRQFDAIGAK